MINTLQATNILGCSKVTFFGYIRSGLIKISEKKGNANLFLEEDVKSLIAISDNGKKHTAEKFLKKSEKKIQVQKDTPVELNSELNEIGMQVVSETTLELKELGLYRPIDIYPIMDIARTYQMYMHHFEKAMAGGGVTYDLIGAEKISPHMAIYTTLGKIIDDKRKRLGLDPESRQKLTAVERKQNSDMGDLF